MMSLTIKQQSKLTAQPLNWILFGLSLALVIFTLYLIFLYVPTDANLGISQRIFYIHVPIAWLGMISIIIVAVASALYLWTKNQKWDDLAYSTAEYGMIFATLIIVTGAIWAKPVWGVWWTWDSKLTTTLILWFIYASYLILRAYGPKGIQQARYAAIIALIGAIDAPIIYLATEWWRTAHPSYVIGPLNESGGLDTQMRTAFLVSIIAFTVLYAFLLSNRYKIRRSESELDVLHQEVSAIE
tara:strand:- start:33084 stop:33809 length:726 start_codon:yes stop_codon:yes gene_type:complete